MKRLAFSALALLCAGCFSTSIRVSEAPVSTKTHVAPLEGVPARTSFSVAGSSATSALLLVQEEQVCTETLVAYRTQEEVQERRPGIPVYVFSGMLIVTGVQESIRHKDPITFVAIGAGVALLGGHLLGWKTSRRELPPSVSELRRSVISCGRRPATGVPVFVRTGDRTFAGQTDDRGTIQVPFALNKESVVFLRGIWAPNPDGLPEPRVPPSAEPPPPRRPVGDGLW